MVRLVSSRLYRCYSTTSVAKSAAIEKLTCVLHVLSCLGFVWTGDWASHLVVSPSASPIPSVTRTVSIVLLIAVHCADFSAVCTAHVKFQKPSSPGTSRGGNTSSLPTSSSKTLRRPGLFAIFASSSDFGVTFVYLFSTFVLLFSTIHYHHYYLVHAASASSLLPPSDEQAIEQQLQVRTAMFFAVFTTMAGVVNLIVPVSNPRMLLANNNSPHSGRDSNSVFLALIRLHNVVAALFYIASSTKLIALAALIVAGADPVRPLVRLTADLIFASNLVVLAATCINMYRVTRFASATHFWALHDIKRLGHKAADTTVKRGLFAWLRPSKPGEDSDDGDSDNFDGMSYSFDDVNDLNKKDSKRLVLP